MFLSPGPRPFIMPTTKTAILPPTTLSERCYFLLQLFLLFRYFLLKLFLLYSYFLLTCFVLYLRFLLKFPTAFISYWNYSYCTAISYWFCVPTVLIYISHCNYSCCTDVFTAIILAVLTVVTETGLAVRTFLTEWADIA